MIGWKLDRAQRQSLLERFPPKFAQTVADHVTLAADAGRGSSLPAETEGLIVGRADDGKGVEAMIVAIGGTSDRPDESHYHITWSLAAGRRAKESNDMLRRRTWIPIDPPIPIRLAPAWLR